MTDKQENIDRVVVKDFGSEWSRFDQAELSASDRSGMFHDFFRVFPWSRIGSAAIGADVGCGSGRWAALVAPRVGHLHLVEPSVDALAVAKRNLAGFGNVSFHQASVGALPFEPAELDFAYALGVLHHVPDTRAAITSIARVLKPGAPCLVYLYYAFDHRPWWFRMLWRCSDLLRRIICLLPPRVKQLCCDVIALTIYLPLARTARLLDRMGILPRGWPLAWYRDRAFYVLRTDALDRFGTRLEQRFSRREVESMLLDAGFDRISFSDREPFWCAVGFKRPRQQT